ncbi:dipeptide ABC transporter ATP-binding protein [Maritalea myrionectae]|uniref:dipeptide ABC transporter ATP-binding protein n=1 Tax=Maritalea myrionectae TaxID=454601 RepID=UPI000414E2B9|nr:ABC transporter ATP-binding protein [Maritalea myrionectae]
MSLAKLEQLTVRFGDREVLSRLDLEIQPGAQVGLVGESGSGKSLTALTLMNLLPERAEVSGEIGFSFDQRTKIDAAQLGEDLNFPYRGAQIGMVFQEPMTALNPLMRTGDQIGEVLALHRPENNTKAHIEALLAEVDLPAHMRTRYPHELSGGQRQRVGLAMALAGEPALLIADEPTSALDMITQRGVIDLIKRIARERKMALLFISHDLGAVAALCDQIYVLEKGKLVEHGPSQAILQSPQQAYTKRLVAAAKPTPRPAFTRTKSATPLLQVNGLTRQFRQRRWLWQRPSPVTAVDAATFELHAGETLGLVGPSGCGKTSLSRMIAGLDPAQAGEVHFDGHRFGHKQGSMPRAARREISMVFQDPFGSFDPRMRMRDALFEPLHLMPELSAEQRQERVTEAIERVGLSTDMLGRYPHAFSGGQRQRLAIARAMVLKPKLMILDEPVSALDVSIRGDVLALLHDLQEKFGMAYLFISHDLDVVRTVTDRVMVMNHGQIVERGKVDDVFDRPQAEITKKLLDARLTILG